MYNINKRKHINSPSVREFIKILKELPEDAIVLCCGENESLDSC
jgi:hypothetical protein